MVWTGTTKRIAVVAGVAGIVLLADQLFGPDDASSAVGPPATKRIALSGSARAATAPNDSVGAIPPDNGLDRLDRRRTSLSDKQASGVDLFGARSWKVEPPTPHAEIAPAPKPVAPAFPYSYLGALTDDGVRTAFFSKGERVLPVKAGDLVDAVYRVEQMTEKQMTVTYLPLNESMVVALGSEP